MGRKVAIAGVGLTKCSSHRKDVTYPELVYEAVSGALADAGIGFEQIDAVVYGSMDTFGGVFAPERWCVDSCVSAGFLNKPMLKIDHRRHHRRLYGPGRLLSRRLGDVRRGAGGGLGAGGRGARSPARPQHGGRPHLRALDRAGAITIAANQASSHFHYYGTTQEDLAMVAAKNYANALNNPYAHLQRHLTVEDALRSRMVSWPLRLSDCCPSSDGACAVIFASEERARQIAKQPAWVRGAGQITDNYFAVDRPWFHDWDSLAMLARRVYKLAKISDPMAEIQVAEPYVAFSIQEILEYEALGFAEPGKGAELIRKGVTAMTGKVPFCPSGNALHKPHRRHGSCPRRGGGAAGDGQCRQAAGAQRQDCSGSLLGRRCRLSHHDDPGQGSSLEGGGRLP